VKVKAETMDWTLTLKRRSVNLIIYCLLILFSTQTLLCRIVEYLIHALIQDFGVVPLLVKNFTSKIKAEYFKSEQGTFKGGFRYTPLDAVSSAEKSRYVQDEMQIYSGQVPEHTRFDGRISYSHNKPKMAGKINLDIQSVLDNQNAISVGYNVQSNSTYFLYRGSGFVPVLPFQWNF
jgi:hypothetical protein